MSTAAEEKARLRTALLAQAAALSPAQRARSDEALFRNLESLPQFARSRVILAFAGMGTEPDTLPFLRRLAERGKTVALPRYLPDRSLVCHLLVPDQLLRLHPYGMEEPPEHAPVVAQCEIDFALIPAVCYDRPGNRLGRGAGCYDRWLAGYRGFSAGLCRDCLLQESLPAEPHDRPVRAVLTETQVFLR